ncbi:MAG: hypothetical protein NW217_08905, partial [Hyphomicrobiaceae bacterium]|nr:hypothetical protein [Hyphomicrobiaceae bacterium]
MLAAALAAVPYPAMAAGPARDDSRYQYALTLDAAMDCALIQQTLSTMKKDSDPEWYRRHFAMAATWQAVAEQLNGGAPSDEAYAARANTLNARHDPALDDLTEITGWAQPCEVMRQIHEEYYSALDALEPQYPDLFADNSGKKNQTGTDVYPDLPRKTLTFGDWAFAASGNQCRLTHTFADGAVLTLGFTNFFDGELTFAWKRLPKLDPERDDYAAQIAPHLKGTASDEETFATILANGVTYESFPGTAIFVDHRIVGTMNPNSGRSSGQSYAFGEAIQHPYY